MELGDYVRLLRTNLLLILLTTLVGAGVAAAYSLTRTPQFEAQSTVFVSAQPAASVQELNQGSNYTQARVKSYVNLVTTPIVLDPVIAELQLQLSQDALAELVKVSSPTGTTLIQIAARDADPARAAAVSNALAKSLSTVVEQIETPAGQTVSPVRLAIVRPAAAPLAAVTPRLVPNIAVGLLVGLAVGLGVAVLRRLLDSRIRTGRDVAAVSDVPVISTMALDPQVDSRPLVVRDDPHSARAEAFRMLRTNVQSVDLEGPRSIVVTSAAPAEGKTTTAANLAIAMADAGARVALVDADLRDPEVSTYLKIDAGVGLTDVLRGRAELGDALRRWGSEDLHVLRAGPSAPNPSELLGSPAMARLLEQLETDFDVVLLDTPPLLAVTDGAVLAKRAGAVILVAAAGATTRHELAGALGALQRVGAHVAGVVLTMVAVKDPDPYGYGSGKGRRGASVGAGEKTASATGR